MNAILDKAIKAAATLSEDDQIEVAEGVLAFVELRHAKSPFLTPEQVAGVEEARAAARRGEFATDEEMAGTWKRFGL